ncbi:MAG TPA: hypothetical protein VLV78_22800 [Thermoanaerobaculia bacterium]|nr:hypothetical protein [Thermoanaerobaculia bacterium]
MRSSLFAVALVLLSGCSSMQSDSGMGSAKVDIAEPQLLIRQISTVPAAAQHIEGGIPVQYSLAVQNRAAQPITLKQVGVVSMGYGAYNVSGTRPFKTVIQPGQTEVVQFWVPANIDNASLVGANGPVTLRVTTRFDSPLGQFQNIVVQQVNATTGVEGSNQ